MSSQLNTALMMFAEKSATMIGLTTPIPCRYRRNAE
jgi:hypothetical protein